MQRLFYCCKSCEFSKVKTGVIRLINNQLVKKVIEALLLK